MCTQADFKDASMILHYILKVNLLSTFCKDLIRILMQKSAVTNLMCSVYFWQIFKDYKG